MPPTLPYDRYLHAREFIAHNARPLDQRQAERHFDGEPAAAVLAALSAYQNADGGFAHGLEPDSTSPVSNALDSTVAFQHLELAGAPGDTAIAARAIGWLVEAWSPELKGWRNTTPEVNDWPRAPWWQHVDPVPEEESYAFNPSCEIVGWLQLNEDNVPPDLLEAARRHALQAVHAREMDGHDFLCALRMARKLPPDLREEVLPHLAEAADRVVTRDRTGWASYGIRPLWAVEAPDDLLAERFADILDPAIDYEIEQQAEDGGWHPNWAWAEYPDAWRLAERAWAGHLTMKTLVTLDRFGRIEGP